MTQALEKYPKHQPHFALLLAFIKLFKYAQNNINRITKRHLDFYYKKVLHLKEKDAVPDQVHLIFELAKNFSSYTLSKGTLLKAGKDATSVAVSYQTDKELVVNTALIKVINMTDNSPLNIILNLPNRYALFKNSSLYKGDTYILRLIKSEITPKNK